MFEDITTPSSDELLKQIKELEEENTELEIENLCQRRRMVKEWEMIQETIHIVDEYQKIYGEDTYKKVREKVKKKLKENTEEDN
jgi:hypothetical protein